MRIIITCKRCEGIFLSVYIYMYINRGSYYLYIQNSRAKKPSIAKGSKIVTCRQQKAILRKQLDHSSQASQHVMIRNGSEFYGGSL